QFSERTTQSREASVSASLLFIPGLFAAVVLNIMPHSLRAGVVRLGKSSNKMEDRKCFKNRRKLHWSTFSHWFKTLDFCSLSESKRSRVCLAPPDEPSPRHGRVLFLAGCWIL